MTLIRKLAWALCLALLLSSYSNSQTLDSTTGNLINFTGSPTDTTSNWNNAVYVNGLTCWQPGGPGNCGPYPNVQTNGSINFSYGQVNLNQIININNALAAGGTGVQLTGFNFRFTAKNGNGWDNGQQDYLDAYVKFYNTTGNIAASYDYLNQTNRKYNWTTFNFNETFASPIVASTLSTAQVGFIGRDTNGWAGPYGPEIYGVNFNLKYRVDPCSTNPAYAPTCSGFSDVVTSKNLLDSNTWAPNLNQAFAVNTALTNAGIGATVHGFNYSFDYKVGTSWSGCTATNQDGSCSWYMSIPASVKLTASMTNSNNQSLYQKNYSLVGDGTSGTINEKYLLPTSLNQTSLGTIRMSGSSMGEGSSLGNFSASMIYTADPCANNPLYNTSCTGYNTAFAKQFLPSTSSAPTEYSNSGALQSPIPNSPQMSGVTPNENTPVQQQNLAPGPIAGNAPANNAAPSATNPQPKPGDVQIAGSTKSSSAGPSASVMSIVATAQARVGATEKAAVQQANETATTATAQAVSVAESVASSAQATSIADSLSTISTTTTNKVITNNQNASGTFSLQTNTQTSVVSVGTLKPYSPPTEIVEITNTTNSFSNLDMFKIAPNLAPQVASFQPDQNMVSNLPSFQQTQQLIQPIITFQQTEQPVQLYQSPAQVMQPVVNYSLTETSTFNFETPKRMEQNIFVEPETPKTEGFKMGSINVANDYMNEKPFMSLMGAETTQDGMIKRNVQPNEVAGGVDIASMNTQPKGYDVYSQMTLKDVNFYKIEEIYKNQKTVDNVQLLRGLQRGSDRLHQEMVNQQFKLGN